MYFLILKYFYILFVIEKHKVLKFNQRDEKRLFDHKIIKNNFAPFVSSVSLPYLSTSLICARRIFEECLFSKRAARREDETRECRVSMATERALYANEAESCQASPRVFSWPRLIFPPKIGKSFYDKIF